MQGFLGAGDLASIMRDNTPTHDDFELRRQWQEIVLSMGMELAKHWPDFVFTDFRAACGWHE